MWRVHYYPQVHWIKQDVYSNTIVITYEEDLNNKINALFDYLNIPNKNIKLEHNNVTRKKEGEEVVLDDEDIQFIKERYKDDFELWENALNHPEMFKKVL